MSAECFKCGWDLSYEGECVRCELERVRDRLADWIEANVEGAEVFRDTGLVVT